MAKLQHGFRVTVKVFVPYDRARPATMGDAAAAVKDVHTVDGLTTLLAAEGLIIESSEPKSGTRKTED